MQHINSSNSSFTANVLPGNLAASAVLGLCFALGVPGNITVLVLLTGWLKGGHFTPKLMLSLAVSDLLTLLSLPVWIWALQHKWIFGTFFCKFLSYIVYWSLYSSLFCVTLLSAQRYLQVLHSQRWAMLGARGQNGLLGGIWILSGFVGSYGLIQNTVELDKDGRLYCRPCYWNDVAKVFTLLWEILVLSAVSFPLIVYFYLRLHQGVNQLASFNCQRMTKVVTRIVVAFFLFWFPYIVINTLLIIAVLMRHESLLRFVEDASSVAGAVTFINSCVNPFLYAFSAQALQHHPPTETR